MRIAVGIVSIPCSKPKLWPIPVYHPPSLLFWRYLRRRKFSSGSAEHITRKELRIQTETYRNSNKNALLPLFPEYCKSYLISRLGMTSHMVADSTVVSGVLKTWGSRWNYLRSLYESEDRGDPTDRPFSHLGCAKAFGTPALKLIKLQYLGIVHTKSILLVMLYSNFELQSSQNCLCSMNRSYFCRLWVMYVVRLCLDPSFTRSFEVFKYDVAGPNSCWDTDGNSAGSSRSYYELSMGLP
jgi:hypothetical protein